ncbi:hypothetical protein [Thermomonas mangrovi]|uniref:hypothetical protein n=1 Tax=Thermomonas mangrovi TaxID=2993316 RepID=UPI0023074F1B|nr:hypothetical protein [Thermomonas mangrovi]
MNEILDRETALGTTFVLPIATLVETGNHIAQAPNSRYEVAQTLVAHLRATLDGDNPWATFTEQSDLWGEVSLRRLSDEWPVMAAQRMAMGDITIKFVADYYSEAGYDVEILTADTNLKAYEPKRPAQVPRRRA